jgi:protein-S-isoprenylcysteine O-methyltransferase
LNWPDSLAIVLVADLLLTAGIVLRIWSIVHLGRFFTVDVAIQEGQRVVRDGPYRFVRHPS